MSNKKKNTGKSILSVVVWLLLVALLLGVVGFFARFTNNFTSGFSTFYVEFGDKQITNDKDSYVFEKDSEYRFDVGYSLAFLNKDGKNGFSVQVLPNITDETNFEFTADDERYLYSDIKDLTACFNVRCYDSYFTLTADKDLPAIIQSLHQDKALSTIPTTIDGGKDYFLLVISNEDNSTSIRISFNLVSSYFEFTPDHIVF